MKPNFDVELLPEAIEFLDRLDDKTREKIYYNIKKAQFVNDNELFKKLNDFIWEFRTLYKSKAYRLFLFGIKQMTIKLWLWRHMEFLKRRRKHHLKKLRRQKK